MFPLFQFTAAVAPTDTTKDCPETLAFPVIPRVLPSKVRFDCATDPVPPALEVRTLFVPPEVITTEVPEDPDEPEVPEDPDEPEVPLVPAPPVAPVAPDIPGAPCKLQVEGRSTPEVLDVA